MSISSSALGFILLIICLTPLINGVTITTPQGKIKGVVKKTLNGREFQAFRSVPYAKPPIEFLRFQDPVSFGKWEGEHDGTKEAPACIQKYLYDNVARHHVIGEEDCLYLNVYTPSSKKPKKYPVMVYIHGGGFMCGSSSSGLYGPEYLLDKDVILVTFNYRLGVLGFASTEDVTLPGNFGLKDQVESLRWVKENIAAYGGNPDSVTIFGQSAGGASVHYHMISPLSKGLFHRAILMSGTAHCPWALAPPGVNRERTHKLATLVGCSTDSSQLLLECFRTVSAYTFADMLTEFAVWGIDPVIPFNPVIEPSGVKNAFLVKDPHTVTTTAIPMMIGLTSQEGAFRTSLFITSPPGTEKTLEVLNDNFNDISKVSLTIYEDSSINYEELGNTIRKFYFGDKTIDKTVLPQIVNMYTDAWFLQCTASAVRNHKGPSNVYLFAQRGPHSTSFTQSNSTEYFGVNHGDDLIYLFPMTDGVPSRKFLTAQEKKTEHEMVTLWTNFAIHGDPTPTNSKWKKVTTNDINYLHIEDGKFEMRDKLLPERVKFWENLRWKSKDAAKNIQKEEL